MQQAGVMDLLREVFLGCLKFLNWPMQIEGFTFSLWQIAMFTWMFILSFNFICRMFGHEPIDQAEHEAEWYEHSGRKENGRSYTDWRRRTYHN